VRDPIRIACIIAFSACVGSFVWAMSGRFFKTFGRRASGFRMIQVAGTISGIINLYALIASEHMSSISGAAGLALYAISFAQFWRCIASHKENPPTHAFSADPPLRLVCNGPYRSVRHPFYSSYLLTWLAGFVATRSGILLLPFLAMLAIYWRAARYEEGKFSTSNLAEKYAAYRARSGMFLPWK
jgi:protein-S-isoprenylcysteine O-methyltransferase Ste14